MKIYRGNTEIADVFLKNSYENEEISGQFIAYLEFDVLNPISLTIGDRIKYMGNTYYIRYKESTKKEETSLGYSYKITFYHEVYLLQDFPFRLYDTIELKKKVNTYHGTAAQVLALIVSSMNKEDPGWTVGECAETEAETFDCQDKMCADMVNDLMSRYNIEYWCSGKTLSLGKREYDSNGLVLSQGAEGGFKSLELSAVDDTPPITRLIAYGSDKNISKEYGDYLKLPGGVEYLEKNADKYGVRYKYKQYDKIFPKGEFTISEVVDTLVFKASDVDFDLKNHLIDGVEVILSFQTGALAGYDLTILTKDDGKWIGWENDTKQITVIKNKEENALEVPGDINFTVGDKFFFTGIKMPQSYETKAEERLLEEATKELDELCENRVQLRGECDEIIFAERDIHITCGQMVGVFDQKLNIDREIRVTAVKRFIENDEETPYRYELILSDFLSGNGFKDLVDEVKDIPKQIEDKVDPIKGFTNRTWRDVQETKKMMYDPESQFWQDITSSIVGEFGHLIVGFQSSQMDFLGVRFQPNYNNNHNNFRSTAGALIHNTINGDETTKIWSISAANLSLNNSYAYYIYAKCSVGGDSGTIIASNTQIKLKEVTGYYHFWIGVLNTPLTDLGVTTRSWKPVFGFTEISGSDIVTGVVRDRLNRLVIDLVNANIIARNGATIMGKIIFESGTKGYNEIGDRPDLTSWSNTILNQSYSYSDAVSKSAAQYWSNENGREIRENLAKYIGYDSYNHLVSQALNGKTIVYGGYIRTSLIDAEAVVATVVTADYLNSKFVETDQLWVKSGARIGGFKVSGNGLTNDPFDNDAYIIFRNDKNKAFAGIGGNILPATTGAIGVARFENYATNEWLGSVNYALLVGASGADGESNHAINIMRGFISGFAVKPKQIDASTTLSHADVFVTCYNASAINVYLPPNPEPGKLIYIRKMNTVQVTVHGNGKTIHNHMSNKVSSITWGTDGDLAMFFYDGQYWCFNRMGRN